MLRQEVFQSEINILEVCVIPVNYWLAQELDIKVGQHQHNFYDFRFLNAKVREVNVILETLGDVSVFVKNLRGDQCNLPLLS